MSNDPITISWDELGTRKVDQRLREAAASVATAALRPARRHASTRCRPGPIQPHAQHHFLHGSVGGDRRISGLGMWAGNAVPVGRTEGVGCAAPHATHRVSARSARAHGGGCGIDSRGDPQQCPQQPLFRDPFRPSFDLRAADAAAQSGGASRQSQAICPERRELRTVGDAPGAVPGNRRTAHGTEHAARLVRNGALGAGLGLLGGVVVSLFVDRLYQAAAGSHTGDTTNFTFRDIIARMLAWGVLGLFLTIGPGVLLRNPRKLLIGAAGGLIGGMLGGMLFDPIGYLVGAQVSRLICFDGDRRPGGRRHRVDRERRQDRLGPRHPRFSLPASNSSSTAIPPTSAARRTARSTCSAIRRSAAATRRCTWWPAGSTWKTCPWAAIRASMAGP